MEKDFLEGSSLRKEINGNRICCLCVWNPSEDRNQEVTKRQGVEREDMHLKPELSLSSRGGFFKKLIALLIQPNYKQAR